MSNEVFQLSTLTRALAENVALGEALGFSEISALDDTERKRTASLGTKAKTILEDPELSPAISLHRRRLVAEVELDQDATPELKLQPPDRLTPAVRAPQIREPVDATPADLLSLVIQTSY